MNAVDDPLAHVNRVVAASGSSFSLGMRFLPAERRRAMFAIYAFCREVDDIADKTGSADEKIGRLLAWRDEISRIFAGNPTNQTALALAGPVATFDLPRKELMAVIDGVAMDARNEMVAPTNAQLDQYCRNVAGAVGLLSIHVFGDTQPTAERFAIALGHAFQLTNILRDIDEDAANGRLYLPRELLIRHGLDPALPPRELAGDARIALVCQDLARTARELFADADRLLARCDRARLRPALLMFGIYEDLLDRLERTAWQPPRTRPRPSKRSKVLAALRQGLFRPRWRPSTS